MSRKGTEFDESKIREIEFSDTVDPDTVKQELIGQNKKIHEDRGVSLVNTQDRSLMSPQDIALLNMTQESKDDFKSRLVQQKVKGAEKHNVTRETCDGRGCLYLKTTVPAKGGSRHVNYPVKYTDPDTGMDKKQSVGAHKVGWWLYSANEDASQLGDFSIKGQQRDEAIEHYCTRVNKNTQEDDIPNQMCVRHTVKGSSVSNMVTRGQDDQVKKAAGTARSLTKVPDAHLFEMLETREIEANKDVHPTPTTVLFSRFGYSHDTEAVNKVLRGSGSRGKSIHSTFFGQGYRVPKEDRVQDFDELGLGEGLSTSVKKTGQEVSTRSKTNALKSQRTSQILAQQKPDTDDNASNQLELY